MFRIRDKSDRVLDLLLLSAAANNEAERMGHTQVDTDHLLLGLISLGGPAAQVLRRRGVTLGRARAAVEEIQRHDLETVGIEVPETTLAAPTHYSSELKPRTRTAAAAVGIEPGDGVALLRHLLADSEGQASRVVAHLGADITEADLGDTGAGRRSKTSAGWQSTCSVDVTADRDRVWSLLDDPVRRPAWDTDTDRVVVIDDEHFIGRPPLADDESGLVGMLVRGVDLDVHHHLSLREPGRTIQWRTVFPARGHTEHLRIELEDTEVGTRLTLSHRDERRGGLRSQVLRWVSAGHLRLRAQAITQAVG